jgi:hypothetical protein
MIKPGETITKTITADWQFVLRWKTEFDPEYKAIRSAPYGYVKVGSYQIDIRFNPGANHPSWDLFDLGVVCEVSLNGGGWQQIGWWKTHSGGWEIACDHTGVATVTLAVEQDYVVSASSSEVYDTGDLCTGDNPPLWCDTPDKNGSFDHGWLTEVALTEDGDARFSMDVTVTGAETGGTSASTSGTGTAIPFTTELSEGYAWQYAESSGIYARNDFDADVLFATGKTTATPTDVVPFPSSDVTYQQGYGTMRLMRVTTAEGEFSAYITAESYQEDNLAFGVFYYMNQLPVSYTYVFDFPDDQSTGYEVAINEWVSTYDPETYAWVREAHPYPVVTGGGQTLVVNYKGHLMVQTPGAAAESGQTWPEGWNGEHGFLEIDDRPDGSEKYAVVSTDSLTENGQPQFEAVMDGEDIIVPARGDCRLPMRLQSWTWAALSMQVHSPVVLHELDTTTGWTCTNVTASLVGGSLTLAVAVGQIGSAVKDYSGTSVPPNFCHYRFCDIDWSCTDNTKGFRLVLLLSSTVGRYWDIAADQTEIDLCCPTGLYNSGVYSTWTGGDADEQSYLPYGIPLDELSGTPTIEEWYWGVKELHSIKVDNLAGDETYTLTSITGKVKTSAVWYDSNQWGWRDEVTSTDPEPPDAIAMAYAGESQYYKTYREIAGWILVDGMPAVEIAGQCWILPKDGTTPPWHVNTVPAIEAIEYWPKRNVADSVTSFSISAASGGAGFLDNDQTVRHINTSDDYLSGLTTETDIGATYRTDRVSLPHGAGYDGWTMVFRKRWGHWLSGIILENGEPDAGKSVTVRYGSSHQYTTSASTDSQGHLYVRVPRQPDGSTVKFEVGDQSIEVPVRQRRMTFFGVAFLTETSGSSVGIDYSSGAGRAYVVADTDDGIRLYIYPHTGAVTSSLIPDTAGALSPKIACIAGRSDTLNVVYGLSGTVYFRKSGNGGNDWDTAMSIATGAHPAIIHMEGAGISLCGYIASGTVYVKRSLDMGATWGAAISVATGAADDAVDICPVPGRAASAWLVYRDGTSGAIVRTRTADAGLSWTADS